MELVGVLFGLFALAVGALFPILTLVAFFSTRKLRTDVFRLEQDLKALENRLAAAVKTGRVETRVSAAEPARESTAPVAPATPPAPTTPPTVVAPVASSGPMPAAAPEPPPPPSPPRPVVRPPAPPTPPPVQVPAAPRPDFLTSVGPKIMVGVAALFVVISLGLFVRYAWENNWVGPTGRILLGATASLALLAFGTRIMGREYRPLGQGLAATGVAGLYVCAFGAHGFYDLIPRGAAGFLMVVITICAVLLAVRLDARLLASLAWVGGYLTPILLSTGEDRAMALFLYLVLLDLGALALDHLKPWPETMPIAMLGTLVLYGGWYARFISADNFMTAAFGMVLFTALFALGMARKERPSGLAVVFAVAAFGLSLLAFVPGGRAEILLALSLGLGAVALREARRAGVGLAVVAGLAFVLPFVCWMSVHGRDLTFGIGAAWLLAATVLFVATAATSTKAVPMPLEAAALVVSGFLTIALSGVPKTPLPLLGLLLAQGAIAVLAVKRFAGAELTSLVAAGLAILANFDRLQKAGGANAVYLVALPVFAFYLLVPVVRRAVGPRVDSDIVGSLTQLANAVFLWSVLYRILYDAHPGLLGFVSVALAVLYLLLGLVIARVQPSDVIGVRTLLGLAASFLTLAIPVQLGLHGITLAWALEGLVLLGLGVRFSSVLTRFGGYGVLALAVGRLFVRHLPLHPDAFVPVMNPSFGIWIAVILCLGAALVVTRAPRREGQALDWVAGRALSVVGLALLFGVLTGESTAAFGQVERLAREAGDAEAAQRARLMGGLSLSVLWSLFATGLLVGGLALRSRALFYTAYALFAVTAAKIVLVDLATLKTVYRILSFLAMGVLLMAGAYLAIRFRARLSTEAPAP